ncbi:MAG TPA: hypothetical protein VM187_05755, partial [Niastella sp.]|nr:hypothetical protein [Niastella sp.]
QTIREVYERDHYLLDPHGAVGYKALETYLQAHPGSEGIFLETAHPVKFYDVVEPVIEGDVPIPDTVQHLFRKQKQSITMKATSAELKQFLLDRRA